MKYRFSEIIRFGNYWSWERPYAGKYGCQVFDERGAYITFILCNTREEVEKKIEKLKRK